MQVLEALRSETFKRYVDFTKDPADSHNFKKSHNHEGNDGGVVVHQLKHIDTALWRKENKELVRETLKRQNSCYNKTASRMFLSLYCTLVMWGIPSKNKTIQTIRATSSSLLRKRIIFGPNSSFMNVTATSDVANCRKQYLIMTATRFSCT